MKAVGFGHKLAWLAFRDADPRAVMQALTLEDVRESDWKAGVEAAYAGTGTGAGATVFVTPPVDGWVLCAGIPFFRHIGFRLKSPPAFSDVIRRLSGELGTEVQFFATHRVSEAHAWGRASRGQIQRAYFYLGERGEVPLNVGEISTEERELGAVFSDPERSADDENARFPHEENVMKLAARWSVNPSALDDRDIDVGPGWVGVYWRIAPRSKSQPPAQVAPRPWYKFW